MKLSHQTTSCINAAKSASRKLEELMEENEDRHVFNPKHEDRRYYLVDKGRLEAAITAAAMVLATTASKAETMIRATINNEYWAVSMREREREMEKIKDYKITLDKLSSDGLFNKDEFSRTFRTTNKGLIYTRTIYDGSDSE